MCGGVSQERNEGHVLKDDRDCPSGFRDDGPRLRRPEGLREHTGFLVKSIVCPVLGACATWWLIRPSPWHVGLKIIIGLILWWFWFKRLFVWLLAPVWNRLYIPRPDLPTDTGVIDSSLFAVPGISGLLVRGIGGEFLLYSPDETGSAIRLASCLPADVEKKMVTRGQIRLNYSFEGYSLKTMHLSYYRNSGRIEYRWPRYSYTVAHGTSPAPL